MLLCDWINWQKFRLDGRLRHQSREGRFPPSTALLATISHNLLVTTAVPLGMNRDGALRTRGGSRRGDALIARLVKTMPAPRASSTSNPWLAQNWGVLVMAAATVATVPCLLGTTDSPRPGAMTSSTGVGHQSLFATPKSRGGISIAQQRSSGWSAGRALQEQTTVTTPVVQYGTNLQLFMCNPSPEEGNDASLVDEDSLAAALSKVSGLQQVSLNGTAVQSISAAGVYVHGTREQYTANPWLHWLLVTDKTTLTVVPHDPAYSES